MPTDPPHVLIIGTGHYVTGHLADAPTIATDKDLGVMLPACLALQQLGLLQSVSVAGRDGTAARDRVNRSVRLTTGGTDLAVRTFPPNGQVDDLAYIRAIEEMPRPLVALIAVPDHLHDEVITACIERDVPFLVVKPAYRRLNQYHRAVDALHQRRGFGAVDFHKIFDDANVRIGRSVADGRLGQIQSVLSVHSQRRVMRHAYNRWLTLDRELNVFDYLGSHSVHLVGHWTGARPITVRSTGQTPPSAARSSSPDMITTTITWRDSGGLEFVSTHITGWGDPEQSPAMSDQWFVIWGTEGRIESDQGDRGIREVIGDEPLQTPNPYFFGLQPGPGFAMRLVGKYGFESIRAFITAAAQHLSGDMDASTALPVPRLEDTEDVTAVLEASALSLDRDAAVIRIETTGDRRSISRP